MLVFILGTAQIATAESCTEVWANCQEQADDRLEECLEEVDLAVETVRRIGGGWLLRSLTRSALTAGCEGASLIESNACASAYETCVDQIPVVTPNPSGKGQG